MIAAKYKSRQKTFGKIKKNFFLSKIGLQFFASHRSAFFSLISRLASVDRKMLSGDLDDFIENICLEEHLLFNRKRGKTSKNGHLEPMG